MIVVAALAAFLLDVFWPWDWSGRRKSLKLRSGRRDWE